MFTDDKYVLARRLDSPVGDGRGPTGVANHTAKQDASSIFRSSVAVVLLFLRLLQPLSDERGVPADALDRMCINRRRGILTCLSF